MPSIACVIKKPTNVVFLSSGLAESFHSWTISVGDTISVTTSSVRRRCINLITCSQFSLALTGPRGDEPTSRPTYIAKPTVVVAGQRLYRTRKRDTRPKQSDQVNASLTTKTLSSTTLVTSITLNISSPRERRYHD
jgi:hypothetical protein